MSFDLSDEEVPLSRPVLPRPSAVRILPHSLEAEEHLLSCCLLDGADTVARCIDTKIGPESFFDPKHAIVYDAIVSLYHGQKPIEVSVVAEELKTARQLDSVGGYAFLMQVSSRIATTAEATYFIEKVREQALLRQIIRSSTSIVEDSYGFSGGIQQYIEETREKMARVLDDAAGSSDILAARKFNPEAAIIDARVAFWLNGIIISTAGNLTNYVAKSGVGKSATIDAMMAAVMKHPDTKADCLGFTSGNPNELPLLHFDTEQSAADYQRLLHRSKRRARVKEFPKWFHSYHLTGLSGSECRQAVMTAIAQHARKSDGKLFGVMIDGVGDLVANPNDEEECFPLVIDLHKCAIRHDCPIITVLHLNPGSEAKSRGHLGSHLERKAEAIMQLEMDEDNISVIWAMKKRGKPLPKIDGPRFTWNDEQEMHTLVENWAADAAAKREARRAKMKERNPTTFSAQYSPEEQVSFYPASTDRPQPRPVIYKRAQEKTKVSDRTLDRLRVQFLKDGWIVDTDTGYRRTREGDDWAKRRPGAEPKPPVQTQVNF